MISILLILIISTTQGYTPLLNLIKNSPLLTQAHEQHVNSPTVSHLMKSTPLVTASDSAKLDFATGFMGKVVADLMKTEQELLGDWKIDKIVEAAGAEFDQVQSHDNLLRILNQGYNNEYEVAPPEVTVFSFVDCPWCLLAKQLLEEQYSTNTTVQIIELEDLQQEGKHLRASIALATGRTSMPACFVHGKSVGGFTDGFDGVRGEGFQYVPPKDVDLRLVGSGGLESLHLSGELRRLLEEGRGLLR